MKLLRAGRNIIRAYSVAVILKDGRQALIVNDYFKRLSEETHRFYEVNLYDSCCRCNLENYDVVLIGVSEEGDKDEAESFLRDNSTAGLILVSDSAKYALWGYAVDAKGYLTSPVDFNCFQRTVNRIFGNRFGY